MSLIRGRNGKCPCPVCLVPLAELHDLSKTYAIRSIEEAMEALRVYKRSKAQGEELLKALGLRPVEVWWTFLHDSNLLILRTRSLEYLLDHMVFGST